MRSVTTFVHFSRTFSSCAHGFRKINWCFWKHRFGRYIDEANHHYILQSCLSLQEGYFIFWMLWSGTLQIYNILLHAHFSILLGQNHYLNNTWHNFTSLEEHPRHLTWHLTLFNHEVVVEDLFKEVCCTRPCMLLLLAFTRTYFYICLHTHVEILTLLFVEGFTGRTAPLSYFISFLKGTVWRSLFSYFMEPYMLELGGCNHLLFYLSIGHQVT